MHSLFESRDDLRMSEVGDAHVYALGIGIRGRFAVKLVDEDVCDTVKVKRLPCDEIQIFVFIPTRNKNKKIYLLCAMTRI